MNARQRRWGLKGIVQPRPQIAIEEQLLLYMFDDSATRQLQYHIEEWRRQRHIIETMPVERLVSYLRFDPLSGLALADAIVCGADTNLVSFQNLVIEPRFPLATAVAVAEAIRGLPEQCAMRDGRKWKTIPFIIFANVVDIVPPYYDMPDDVHVLSPICNRYPFLALEAYPAARR